MLKVQKLLQSRQIKDLTEDPFYLNVIEKGDLVLLKYNQFNSDFANEIVKECRGLILEKGTWKVVCHPFHKFFNLGEANAYQGINLLEAIAFEKVDGSIIKIYHYNDEWRVATNGTINADDATTMDGISFKELFFDVLSKDQFDKLTENLNAENTYLFEIVHPAAQIVVDYENKKELVFTGMIRNNTDGDRILDYDILSIRKKMEKIFNKFPIRYPRVFDLNDVDSLNELIELADEENIDGNNFEGYVIAQVYDGRVIGRIKIKSPKYVNLHHVATGEGVTNNLIDVLMKNELDEFEVYLSKLPKHVADEYKALKRKYFETIEYLYTEGNYYRVKSETVARKELALDILAQVRKGCSGFIFKMVDNPAITPEELLTGLSIKKVKFLLLNENVNG